MNWGERPRLNIRILGETSDQIIVLLERHEIELAIGRFTDPLQHNKFGVAEQRPRRAGSAVGAGHRREHQAALWAARRR